MKDDFLVTAVESSHKRYTKRKQAVIIACVILAGISALGIQKYFQDKSLTKNSNTSAEYRPPEATNSPTKEPNSTHAFSAPEAVSSSNSENSGAVMPSQDEDSRLKQALSHRDRRNFRNAASEAGSKLGDILKLLKKESWISEYTYKENIHKASLELITMPNLINGVSPGDKDPSVTSLQQTAKERLSKYYAATRDTVNAYEAWKHGPSNTTYNHADDLKYHASLSGIEFFNSLDNIPI